MDPRGARRLARLGAIALALSLAIAAARVALFGAPWPQPVVAKSVGLSAIAFSRGIDYLVSLPVFFPLYAGVAVALLLLARGCAAGRLPAGAAAAAGLAAGQVAFAALSGGDWMEAGRLLAPALPCMAVATVFACARLPRRRLRVAALSLFALLSTVGLLDVAQRESTGIPVWTRAESVYLPRYAQSPLVERANRIHVRDMPAAAALGEVLARLATPDGERVTVYTGQGGMILFDALRPLRGRVAVVDRSGLLDRHLTASPTALAHGRSRYGLNVEFDTLLDRYPRIHAESALPAADVVFDLHFSPREQDALRRAGFERVYAQRGAVVHGARRLPGAPVDAGQSIYVRRRHLARLGELPLREFAFGAPEGAALTPPADARATSPSRAAP
jgi:hypothetical protein